MGEPTRLDYALEYARDGRRVLPLWPVRDGRCACGTTAKADGSPGCKPGKHPIGRLVPHGVNDAATGESILRGWWDHFPDANPGIATGPGSGVFVIGPDGPDGLADLDALAAPHGGLPPTLTAESPSLGRHLYFLWPSDGGKEFTTGANHRGTRIDFRGKGGYVVATPAATDRGRYRWVEVRDPAEAPAWLLEWVRGRDPKPTQQQSPPPSPTPPRPPSGSGPSPVTRCASYLRTIPGGVMGAYGSSPCMSAARVCRWGFGLSEAEAWPLMREYSGRCTPPWSDADIKHKLDDAAEQGSFDKPYGWLLNAPPPAGPSIHWNGKPMSGTHAADGHHPGPTAGHEWRQDQSDQPPESGESAPPPSPPPPVVEFITSREFDEWDDRPTWVVERVMVEGEPAVVAGPSKVLKTTAGVDFVISVATGTPFLGAFPVPTPRRVAFASAESGRRTLKRAARNICKARGIQFGDLEDKLVWTFRVPTLSDLGNVSAWALALDGVEADVFVLDPFYLALGDVNAASMFEVGACLRAVSDLLAPSGRTVVLIHHANRSLAVGEAMDLQHMSHAGLEQFTRQFMFLSRRVPYKSDGKHALFLRTGGSAGHSGLYHLDIDEGLLGEDFQGKKWEVTVTDATQARVVENTGKAEQKEAEQRDEIQRRRVSVLVAIRHFTTIGQPASRNKIVEHCGMKAATAEGTIQLLIEGNEIEAYPATHPDKPKAEPFKAYREVERPTPAPEDVFSEPLEHPPAGQGKTPFQETPSPLSGEGKGSDSSGADDPFPSTPFQPPIGGRKGSGKGSSDGETASVSPHRRKNKKRDGIEPEKAKPKTKAKRSTP